MRIYRIYIYIYMYSLFHIIFFEIYFMIMGEEKILHKHKFYEYKWFILLHYNSTLESTKIG